MKRLISSLLLLTVCALIAFAVLGRQEKPEIAFEEYGETRATLPKVDGVSEIFEIPEEVESTTCAIREQALNSARSDRAREEEAAQKADSQTK